jgi:hypothetical protein
VIKPNFDDAPGNDRQRKREQKAAVDSNWKQFLNSAVGKTVTGFGKDLAQGFTGPGSIGANVSKAFNAGAGVVQRNPKILAPFLGQAKPGLDFLSEARREGIAFQEEINKGQAQRLETLIKTDPTNPEIKLLEKELAKPLPEPIDTVTDAATELEKFYDSYHQSAATYLLSKNPDIERKALETNQSIWDTAAAYSKEVSFGQSVFDNVAGFVDRDSMFDIDITDPGQREDMFYSGDGLVGGIGKATSGSIDLGMQLFGDPFWLAGKGLKAARLGLINVNTVAEAEKGIRGLWQQSYFVEGQKGIDDYAKSQINYGKFTDEKNVLEQEKIRLETLRANTEDLIKNPSAEAPLKDSLKTKELLDEEIAKISQQIDDKTLEVRAATPQVSKGHDEFHTQVIEGKLTASDLAEHPRFNRYGAMKTKLAEAYALAARNGDKRDLIDLDLIAMGIDPKAAERLRARRESLWTIINDQNAQLKDLTAELKVLAGSGDDAMTIYKEAKRNAEKLRDAYYLEDQFLSAAVKSENERGISIVGQLDPRGTSRFRTVERSRASTATGRAQLRFDEFRISNLGRSIFLGRPLYGATDRFRPNNMVTIEGIDQADGLDEFTAWLQKAGTNKVSTSRVIGSELSTELRSEFITAGTRAQKEEVLRKAERVFLRELLIKSGVAIPEGKAGENILDTFIDDWLDFKDQEVSTLREKAFFTDKDGNLVDMPLLKPELAYSYYMADSSDLAAWVKDNIPTLDDYFKTGVAKVLGEGTVGGQAKQVVGNFFYIADQMWRFGVLARLGYPVRNVGAEWLKFAVVGGMFRVFGPQHTTTKELPAAVKKSIDAWYSNKHAFYERISIKAAVSKEGKFQIRMKDYPDYVEMNNQLRIGNIQTLIGDMEYTKFEELANKIDSNPELLKDLPDNIEEAYLVRDDIIQSRQKLADIMDRWNATQKTKRRSGTFEAYGYQFEEAFAGTQGAALRDALSSGPTIEMMSTGMIQKAKSKEWMGVHAKIQPTDPEYYPNLSNAISSDFVNSEAAKEVLRVSVAPEDVQGVLREEVVAKFDSDLALKDEIFATGRYRYYKDEIKEEQVKIKKQLKELQAKEEKLIALSPDDVDLLDAGTLPERFGPTSPGYIKAVKAEKKRLTEEFQVDPAYMEKVENLASAFGLSEIGAGKLAEQGLISLRAIRNAYNSGRLNADELSAILSTGNIESASAGGFGEGMYTFYTLSEIEGLAVRRKEGMYFQVPWVEASADEYVASGLKNFENYYYAQRVEDLRTEHSLRMESIDRLKVLQKQLNNPDDLTVEELLSLELKNYDPRTIGERYFDDIFGLVTRYLPDEKLRADVLELKAGESITPEKLRLVLSDRGFNLSPIVGDLLINEERKRAMAFALKEDKKAQGNLETLLDRWLLREGVPGTKVSEEFRVKTPEEQVRALEAQTRLRALDQDASVATLFKDFRQRVFRVIGQIPEDNLVKWPFGGTVYNKHIETIAQNWFKAGFEPTQADFYALHTAARARAIAESRTYLYSAMRKLQGPGNVPFIAPFYQAAITGSKNWARVAWNDPSIIARRIWMFDYINQHADYDKKNGNRTLTVNLPMWLIDSIEALPGDQSAYRNALKAFPNMKFNTSSFNLMFPGMRLNSEGETGGSVQATATGVLGTLFEAVASSIGAGPAVIMSVEELVKRNPNIGYDPTTGKVWPARSILDKIAPSENITADPFVYDALPPVAKRAYALLEGVDSAEYARINLYLFMTYVHRMETGEMPRQPLADIEQRVAQETAAMITIKGLANLTLPAIPQFEGEVNKMVNIYREYQDIHKEKAFGEFVNDYPDWYIVASTMSKNKGGVLSTVDSAAMIDKHKKLMDDVAGMGDDTGIKFLGMLANREGQPSEFDPASRVYLINQEIYKRYKDPLTAIEQTMVSKGNSDYFNNRQFRDEQITKYGISIGRPDLTSANTSVPFVVDQNAAFTSWVESQAKANHTWYVEEWEPKLNGSVQPTAIRAANLALNNEAWMADQTPGNWTVQLRQFLAIQDGAAQMYAEAKAAGNKPLQDRIKMDAAMNIARLVRENETFALWYDRFLDGPNGEPFLQIVPEKEMD